MRKEFIETLTELAERDERIALITGDLGYTVLEPFAERMPDRFYNAGVAEQNMIGMATGLADAGFIPYVYSIATFASMRGYEFLRNGGSLHELPVRVVGVGGGFDYGHNGITHYALEDVGLMRLQPGITTVAPADPEQAAAAVRATNDLPRPVYFRLGKESKPVPGLHGRFELGRVDVLADGSDVVIVALGTMATTAREAARLLERRHDVSATVAVVSSLNPSPRDDLAELLAAVPVAVTVEGHYVGGGVGSLACEVAAEEGLGCRVVRCGVREVPRGETGSQAYLHERHGISAERVAQSTLDALYAARDRGVSTRITA